MTTLARNDRQPQPIADGRGRLSRLVDRSAQLAGRAKVRLVACSLAMRDPRAPRLAKLLIGLAIGYAISPIDLIPDFIPVIGHLDDALIVPGLLWLAVRMIPKEVMDECIANARSGQEPPA